MTPVSKARNASTPRINRLAEFGRNHWQWLVIVCVWLACWWPVIAGNQILFYRDLTFYAMPMKGFMVSEWLAGRLLPLWTPYISAGMPFLAEPSHQALYPGNLIFWLFTQDVLRGLSWFLILHHLAAFAAMYALARRGLSLSRLVAIWTALVYGLSGYVISILDNVNYMPAIAWVPLLMWGWHGIWQATTTRDRRRGAALLAISLACLVLAGDLFNPTVWGLIAVISIGLAALWLLIRTRAEVRQQQFGYLLRGSLWTAGAGLLALLLAAAQWLPSMPVLAASVRHIALPLKETGTWCFPPQRMIELIQPYFFGSQFPSPGFFGMFLYPDFRQPWADSVYLGLIPVFFAINGLLLNARRRRTWFWAGLLLLVLVIAFGSHWGDFFEPLITLLAPLRHHRYLEKAMLWVMAGGAILAGFGLQAWLETRPLQLMQQKSWALRLILAGIILALSTGLLLKLPATLWIWTHANELSVDWYGRFFLRADHVAALLQHWLLICSLLVATLLLWPQRWQAHRHWGVRAIACLAVINLFWMHGRHTVLLPHQLLDPIQNKPLLLSQLPKKTFRIFLDDWTDLWDHPAYAHRLEQLKNALKQNDPVEDPYPVYWPYRVLNARDRLLYNYGALYGVGYLNGRYAPLQAGRHKWLDDTHLKKDADYVTYFRQNGVNAIISSVTPPHEVLTEQPGLTVSWQHKDLNLKILEMPNAWPEFFMARLKPTKNEGSVFTPGQLALAPFDGLATKSPPKTTRTATAAPASKPEIVENVPGKARLRISSTHDGEVLIWLNGHFEGWQATVLKDGKVITRQVPLLANGRYQAVPLPASDEPLEITFEYSPWQPWAGLLLSLLGIGLTLWLVWPRRIALP